MEGVTAPIAAEGPPTVRHQDHTLRAAHVPTTLSRHASMQTYMAHMVGFTVCRCCFFKRMTWYTLSVPTDSGFTMQTKGGSLALKPLAATHVQARHRGKSLHPMPNVPLLKEPPTRKLSVYARRSDVWTVFWGFVVRAEKVGCRF